MLQQNLYGISLGQLEIFFAAAEHNSFTKAAVSLNMTQSAVSKAVAKLEQALDILLFQRRYREIVLTEAGRALYDRWKQSVTEISRSYADVRQVLLSKTRCLRVGATNTTDLTLYFWPLVNRFMQSHSEIRLEFDSDSINRLVEKLMDRRLDLIFIPDFMHYTVEKVGMNWCWAAQDNAQVVLPKEHPLAHETLTLDTIKNEKIAVLDEHTPDNERWLRELFQSKGYQMNIGRVFNSPESYRALLSASGWHHALRPLFRLRPQYRGTRQETAPRRKKRHYLRLAPRSLHRGSPAIPAYYPCPLNE